MNAITSPAIRYHGGKFRLSAWVIKHFPEHQVFVDAFGGAAGILINKPRAYAEVYNDLDGDVVNFFRVLQDNGTRDRLIELISLTPYARGEFDRAWEPSDCAVERARRLVIRAQMGFGSAGATKGRTGFRIDTRRSYGTAQSIWVRYPEQLGAIGERFQGVLIENRDAVQVMQDHDAVDTLHYLDPPYVHSTRSSPRSSGKYYRHELNDADHVRVLETALALRGYVVISGYRSEIYDRLLCDFTRYDTSARISAVRGCGTRIESLWVSPNCESVGLFAARCGGTR